MSRIRMGMGTEPSNLPLRHVVLAFVSVGALVAAAMMYIAWGHNSQGEIHDEAGIYWGYWFFLGGTWFIAIGVVPSVFASLIFYLSRLSRRT